MFAVYHSVFALRWLHMILYSVLMIVLRVVHNLTVYDEIDDICFPVRVTWWHKL